MKTDRADRRKFHVIYKTTHIASGKFYIGMHSTDNLNDGYMGSGKRIRYIINKYGKEACSFEILEYLSDRKSLAAREKDIINEDLLKMPLCINLKIGGTGGGSDCSAARKGFQEKLKNDPEFRKFFKSRAMNGSVAFSDKFKNDPAFKEKIIKHCSEIGKIGFKNKRHTDATKAKIGATNSKHQMGSGNSQFGTMWITNGIENTKIKNSNKIPEGFRKGRVRLMIASSTNG